MMKEKSNKRSILPGNTKYSVELPILGKGNKAAKIRNKASKPEQEKGLSMHLIEYRDCSPSHQVLFRIIKAL